VLSPLFILFYIVTWVIAKIPSKVIYVISDLSYVIVYYIVKYRRDVVRSNLAKSFPSKPINEIKAIERRFYRHFTDLFFENIFLLHASTKRALRRCRFNNLEVFEKLHAEGNSAVVALGHYGNWELLSLMSSQVKHAPLGVYKPLANKRFGDMIGSARKRFGGIPVAMKDTLRTLVYYKKKEIPFLLALIADQKPASAESHYWTTFLNQDTAFFTGVEKIAHKFNIPVYFCHMDKVSRGKYEVNFKLIAQVPSECKPFDITNRYIDEMQRIIETKPELWLWSHRRWKRKRSKVTKNQIAL